MKLAIITRDGETPLQTKELADEIVSRLPPLTRVAVGRVLRKTIQDIERDLKEQTALLAPKHK